MPTEAMTSSNAWLMDWAYSCLEKILEDAEECGEESASTLRACVCELTAGLIISVVEKFISACVCVCVCVRERERERGNWAIWNVLRKVDVIIWRSVFSYCFKETMAVSCGYDCASFQIIMKH